MLRPDLINENGMPKIKFFKEAQRTSILRAAFILRRAHQPLQTRRRQVGSPEVKGSSSLHSHRGGRGPVNAYPTYKPGAVQADLGVSLAEVVRCRLQCRHHAWPPHHPTACREL